MKQSNTEKWIVRVLWAGLVLLVAHQLMSLFIVPIHDSYLWWGDESWLMNEYHSQVTTGVFRHPLAYGCSIWMGNPFPFTSMWVTSAIYGLASLIGTSTMMVDNGRIVTTLLGIAVLCILWRQAKRFGLSSLSILAAILLLASTRSYFLTSHSARYDIISSISVLGVAGLFIRDLETNRERYFQRGLLWGGSLLISIHVPLLLAFPATYHLFIRRARPREIAKLAGGALLSVIVLYLVHLITQPGLSGETNLSENLRTIPILRPLSWSVQSSNLVQKWELIVSFAPQILLMLIACAIGLSGKALSRVHKQATILLLLPMLGWLLFQPAGPSSYLIHFLPCAALAGALSIDKLLAGKWPRIAAGVAALLLIGLGIRDTVTANHIGSELTRSHAKAITEIEQLSITGNIVTMNPAQSLLHGDVATTHFIELPNAKAQKLHGEGYLLTYNSGIQPGFMWEVSPLRAEVTSPQLLLTGHFLDVGRSYFAPLDPREDTLFLQKLDLNGLYTRHIR